MLHATALYIPAAGDMTEIAVFSPPPFTGYWKHQDFDNEFASLFVKACDDCPELVELVCAPNQTID
jgi:hypothetical protein